jgi:8-oxo-dGTP pyrophosphatase MutT (NUDIX family)
MLKVNAAFALINTLSGQHLVVHRKEENSYGLPGGKIGDGEHPKEGLVREIYEETGLKFSEDDFELKFIETRVEGNKELQLYAYVCKKVISDASPILTFEKHIIPMFMEARVFYTMTKYKKFYNHIFEEEF